MKNILTRLCFGILRGKRVGDVYVCAVDSSQGTTELSTLGRDEYACRRWVSTLKESVTKQQGMYRHCVLFLYKVSVFIV